MRRLLAPIVALAVLAVFPATASAAVTQYAEGSCTQAWNGQGNPVPFVCLSESDNHSGDHLTLTGSSDIADLGLLAHVPGSFCSPKTFVDIDDDWNNCISSVWAKLGTGDSVCLYVNHQYNGLQWRAGRPPGPGIWTYQDTDLGSTDLTSSVMLQQSGDQCGEGGV